MQVFFANPRSSARKWTGARVHIAQLVRGLAALGHDVWTFAHAAQDGLRPLPAGAGRRYRRLAAMDAFYVRIDAIPARQPRVLRPPVSWVFRHVPIVWEINATWEADHHDGRQAASNVRAREFARRAKGVTLAICNTAGLADYAADLGVRRRVVIPLGSDPQHFRPRADTAGDASGRTVNVIWCGTLDFSWHDLETMFAAARALRDDRRIRFFLVSDRSFGREVPDNVTLLGHRAYDEMPALLATMDVGLCLYRQGPSSRYGICSSPIKMFDYMAAGLAVVTSRIAQADECFARADFGYLVPPGDVDAVVGALRRVQVGGRELWAKQRAGRRLVEDYYNWNRVARDTAEVLGSVRGRRGS